MKDIGGIDPQLKSIAKKIPYNRLMIKLAKPYQTLALKGTKLLEGVACRRILLKENGRNLPVDIYEPAAATEQLPCLLMIHGGAFSYKASAYHKKLACLYVAEVRCRVIFPDYPLLPEYPYPAAYEACLATLRWGIEHAQTLRIDPTRIGIAGDSAGATLAATLCNSTAAEALPFPCAQMLIYPAVDAAMSTPSMARYTDTPLWNSRSNQKMWKLYLRKADSALIKKASPMHNTLPDKIPPTYMETAEFDCLHDEGVLYAKKLREAGANVELNETKGTIHGYDSALQTQIVKTQIAKRIAFLKKCFSCKKRNADRVACGGGTFKERTWKTSRRK